MDPPEIVGVSKELIQKRPKPNNSVIGDQLQGERTKAHLDYRVGVDLDN